MVRAEALDLEPSDEQSYRAICVPAVLGLLLGLVSWTAFLSYLLWFVPLLAIAISVYGLMQIQRYWPTLSGIAAARTGIALALIFGLGAAVQTGIHRYSFSREAQGAADMWVRLVREGELRRAHQLTIDPAERLPRSADLATGYAEQPALEQKLQAFSTAAAVVRLQQLGEAARVRSLGLDNVNEGRMTARATVDYEVSTGPQRSADDFIFQLVVYRLPDPTTREWTWRVLLEPQIRPLSGAAKGPGAGNSAATAP